MIVRDLFFGVRRFDDLVADLRISRGVLTDRLSTLLDHGVVKRHRYQQRPDRFEYRLTAKGRDLFPVLVALMHWGDTWLSAQAGGPPVVVTHTECGHDIAGPLLCPGCRQPVGPDDVTASAGPGAKHGAPSQAPEPVHDVIR
ncbi:MAG: helix-turn-helix domain-containing protein [Acidimicrobiales bacterium]|nr:helix-turn-helix domain-containing protein [Acidimicrobiales bacterium]